VDERSESLQGEENEGWKLGPIEGSTGMSENSVEAALDLI
jgi:hypothetical protein